MTTVRTEGLCQWKNFEWHHRESNPPAFGLQRSASANCATSSVPQAYGSFPLILPNRLEVKIHLCANGRTLSYFELKESACNACLTPWGLPFAMMSPCMNSVNVSNMTSSEEHSVFHINVYCNNNKRNSVNVLGCEGLAATCIKIAVLGVTPCRW